MAKFKLYITEVAKFIVDVEAVDILEAQAKGAQDFKHSGPVLDVGADFMHQRCIVTDVQYSYETEEVTDG